MTTGKLSAHISVVIPTFNRAYCLNRALDSVFRQSVEVSEIIVVDDGSNDGTYNLLKKYGFSENPNMSERLRYLRQENRGVSAARNLGISHVKGEYIALLDSDDVWHENKIERQLLSFKENNWSKKISHTDEIWIRNGQRVNPQKKHKKTGGYIFENCLLLCCMSPSSVLVHRSLFENYGLFDETLPVCEDYDMWLRVSAFEEVLFLAAPMTIKYGGHKDQLSRSLWGMDRFRVKAIEKLLSNEKLSVTQRNQALKILISKFEILIGGARKRNKNSFAEEIEEKRRYWEGVMQRDE